MRATLSIAKRDILAFFLSPMAYVVITSWAIWCGVTFYIMAAFSAEQFTASATDSPLTYFFGGTTLFFIPLLLFVPALTMRLLAGERQAGTLEAMLTAPVSDVSVVAGKYLASMVFWGSLWAPTLLYVWITSRYGDVDLGAVGASYVGIFGIGLYYMAVGLLMSAASRTQIVAAVLTFMVLGALFLVGVAQFVFQGAAREVLAYVSIWTHMETAARGVIDTRYLVFDFSVAAFVLFLTVKVLELRRYQ